ncbi:PREDICTED: uncharacterized protein LOC106126364 isoform X1 [Papilio xuthus]|uniref:Uncharacterized protein LOC106126364 isoform X1 n=1 Tax=Papilio xuthus TaxID=66420 RepID=A0AAJ6ZUS3_PAPXU|nr:PREDICTED: uncharacterized protein LOC106126364 isoform X1 [Papilio xuthus]
MQTKAEDHCVCWRPYDEVDRYGPRAYRASRGLLALEDWRQDPFLWLHHVPTNNGLQTIDYILGSDDTCFWSIPEVERYFVGRVHCEPVLFPAQYPTLPLPTPHGNHLWRTHTAQKRSHFTYLKEFHRCLQTTMKRMELEESQMERLILSDRLIQLDTMDYYKRKKYFQSLLNILSFQDGLQLVCFENLRCSRLEGVRLVQQLACFNAHSLKYLFLWRFFDSNENPLLVNYSYITGSGAYIPRPRTAHCFSRSLGELLNLRLLSLEYAHLADGTGNALLSLLSILKRPHFTLQSIEYYHTTLLAAVRGGADSRARRARTGRWRARRAGRRVAARHRRLPRPQPRPALLSYVGLRAGEALLEPERAAAGGTLAQRHATAGRSSGRRQFPPTRRLLLRQHSGDIKRTATDEWRGAAAGDAGAAAGAGAAGVRGRGARGGPQGLAGARCLRRLLQTGRNKDSGGSGHRRQRTLPSCRISSEGTVYRYHETFRY